MLGTILAIQVSEVLLPYGPDPSHPDMRLSKTLLLLGGLTGLVAGCGGSGTLRLDSNGDTFNSGGAFLTEGSNILDGMVWQLNRPIRLSFNHPIDPASINFGSIQIRATDPLTVTNPITGTFEIEAGSGGRSILFRPTCPTNDLLTDGAFQPGGFEYEVVLPTQAQSPTVLRDTEGRSLNTGLRRTFVTPALSQPQFLDFVIGPPLATSVTFPEGLNFFTAPDPSVTIVFNQPIDARSFNLNTENIQLLYSDGEVGQAGDTSFSATNRVPGVLVLKENCIEAGSEVEFRITGVLPVNRNLQLIATTQFTDIVGQRNVATVVLGSHATPTLADVYDDPSWVETDETSDEYREDFDDTDMLDLTTALPVPPAQIGDGFVSAAFDFPGNFTSEDNDFFLGSGVEAEIFTDSQTVFVDSNARQFTLLNGVLNVNDLTIESGASLRGRGTNPLVIYATGTVTINGEIDVSGNRANWPTSLNSPQFVEGGAAGECGGGRGGDASQIGDAETLRAENGDGPFGNEFAGGGGGEGGFNGDTSSTGILGLNAAMVGGGGGGGFARTENVSVLWEDWPLGTGWRPSGQDNAGPDHVISRHTQAVGANGIFGAEDGLRGSAVFSGTRPFGIDEPPYGMEDVSPESEADDALGSGANDPDYDPAWTSGAEPPFEFGNPTTGPDGGSAGPSPFSTDGDTLNDFWGSRVTDDGTVEQGELLAPWAGSGGGGSGDSMLLERWDRDGDGFDDPLASFFPANPFARTTSSVQDGWDTYRKGAGGGGGGGQLIIMSIGPLVIGSSGAVKANGGIGFSGESMIFADQGISGSGGGSGGHIILQTATALDLSGISIGTANTAAEFVNLNENEVVTAYGGRRGWAGPEYRSPGDGNGTYAIGRGGAGGNGVIQVHVPDPERDIIWHPSAAAGIADYIATRPETSATKTAEDALDLIFAPRAYALVPFFSSQSMVVSEWIDTGLAELRLGDPNSYPDYADAALRFSGIAPGSGLVQKTGQSVAPLTELFTASTSDASFQAFQVTVPNASALFDPLYLRSPEMLFGYDVLPNSIGSATFQVVDAAYTRSSDVMVLSTRVADSAMTFALDNGNPNWSLRPNFFRVDTVGLKGNLPDSSSIRFEFQGADELAPGANVPGTPLLGDNVWTSNLAVLRGQRFLRYRVTFEADALEAGIDLSSPLSALDYVKIPFRW
jgi:hypothetical protein